MVMSTMCVRVCVCHTYIQWVEVWEATHCLFQEIDGIQIRETSRILHILQSIRKETICEGLC